MKKGKSFLAGAALLVYLGVFFFVYGQDPLPKIPKGVVFLLPVIFLAGASVYFYLKARGSQLAKMSIYMLLGSLCCLTAEVFWVGFDVVLGEPPYPSVADVFYLASYPLLFMGVITQVKMDQLKLDSPALILSSMVVFALMGVTFYYGILQAYEIEAPLLLNIISIVYGLVDIVVLVIALLVLNMAQVVRDFSRGWRLFAVGMGATWIGDLLYALFYEPFNEGIYPYILIDLSWVTWYLLMGLAFLCFASVATSFRANPIVESG